MAQCAERLNQVSVQVTRNLPRNLRTLMARDGLSARMLGMNLGLARTTVNDRLSGEHAFRAHEVVYLAELFGLTVEELVADELPA